MKTVSQFTNTIYFQTQGAQNPKKTDVPTVDDSQGEEEVPVPRPKSKLDLNEPEKVAEDEEIEAEEERAAGPQEESEVIETSRKRKPRKE